MLRLSRDPEWLNGQYNNRLRVPEAPQILARWTRASELARASLRGQLDLRFGEAPSDSLDLFPPAQAPADGAPLLVFLHGGYWRSLDKSDHSFVAPSFVQQGVAVAVPNYALCPAVGVDDIALQCARALAWLWRNAARLGIDARRIVVAGHSAGGHLAAMVLSCQWPRLEPDLPRGLLQGALGISGLYDLEPLRLTPYLNGDLRLTPAVVKRASPAFFPRPDPRLGKFYAVVGLDESDEFQRHNRLIRDAWGPSSVPVCESLAGFNHFSILESLVDPSGRLHQLALRLLGLA